MRVPNMQCYFDYIYNEISVYRQLVFQKLIMSITGGSVADIGCGSVGWYWMLGYIDNVEDVVCIDVHCEYLQELKNTIDTISPQWVNVHVGSTVSYLETLGIDIKKACHAIHTKNISFEKTSILDINVTNVYTHVLAIESLEIVHTQEEFIKNLRTVFSSLRPGGMLLFSILPYDKVIDSVLESQYTHLEGSLNPDYDMIKHCLHIVGFEIQMLESIEIPEYNYSTAIFGKVIKPFYIDT